MWARGRQQRESAAAAMAARTAVGLARQQRGCCTPSGRGMETLLTPSVLPKLSNRFMDTLLTPADGADNRADGPVKAKENGASTNIAKGCLVPFSFASGAFADMSLGSQRTVILPHSLTCYLGCNTRRVQHASGATHALRATLLQHQPFLRKRYLGTSAWVAQLIIITRDGVACLSARQDSALSCRPLRLGRSTHLCDQ